MGVDCSQWPIVPSTWLGAICVLRTDISEHPGPAIELQHAVGVRRFPVHTRLKAAVVAPPHEHVREGQLVVLLLFNRELDSRKHIVEDSKEVIF